MNDQTQERRMRLLLFDDLELFRVCLGRMLGSEPDLEVAAECGTSSEALEVLKSSAVDLVLLDFEVGAEHGNNFISSARGAGYQGRFLVVTESADVRDSAIALKLGASGIFLKTEAPDRLIQAIRHVGNGGVWVDRRIIGLLADQLVESEPKAVEGRGCSPLENRERSVLRGIVGGLTNRKIGEEIGLTESAVKNVVQRLFGKAGVKTRSQLVRATLEGLLGPAHEFINRPPGDMAERAALKPLNTWQPPDAGLRLAGVGESREYPL